MTKPTGAKPSGQVGPFRIRRVRTPGNAIGSAHYSLRPYAFCVLRTVGWMASSVAYGLGNNVRCSGRQNSRSIGLTWEYINFTSTVDGLQEGPR